MMKFIQSPLNYTGGKYKLLNQILPIFPKEIGTFVDLFCGGANVGVNMSCDKIIFNDINYKIISLLQFFKSTDINTLFSKISALIQEYQLSDSAQFGYKAYGCDSFSGLGKYNKDKFLKIRADFNNKQERDENYYIMLYVLLVYSFNNQIRFNNKGHFNLPVGKRDFNKKMQSKLRNFIQRLKTINCQFICRDFYNFPIHSLTNNDFVYLDPPYLITCATYNENSGWNEQNEISLYNFADTLNHRNVKFAISNVLYSKGKHNEILANWLSQRNYACHHLKYGYGNSNYHTKDKSATSDEVLITNY